MERTIRRSIANSIWRTIVNCETAAADPLRDTINNVIDNPCIHTINISINNVHDFSHLLRNKMIFMRAKLIRTLRLRVVYYFIILWRNGISLTSRRSKCEKDTEINGKSNCSDCSLLEFYSTRQEIATNIAKMRFPGQAATFIFIRSPIRVRRREISETRSLLALSRNPFILPRVCTEKAIFAESFRVKGALLFFRAKK